MLNKITQSHQRIVLEINFVYWLKTHGSRDHGHSQNSIQAYVSDIDLFSRWFETRTGDVFSPAMITKMDLDAYADYSINIQHVEASTWNRRRVSLSLFCQFCQESGYIAFNPFQGIMRMETAEEAPKSLDRSQFLNYLRKAEQSINGATTAKARYLAIRNRAMVALMAYAGLRESEVCELTPEDLLLSDRQSEINVQSGKGNKQASAYLAIEGRRSLNAWLEIRKNTTRLFGEITPRQVQRIVADIGTLAGLEVTPHQLRHTFIYNVRQKTGDLQITMRLARHSRIEQTLRYALPHKEDLQAAVNSLSY